LKKRLQNTDNSIVLAVFRLFLQLFHRPAVRFGLARDRRGRFRDPRFVSFLAQNNRRTIDTHVQDAFLRGRRLLRHAFLVGVIAAGAWVAVESAKALTMF
jgi:hypothetical protein